MLETRMSMDGDVVRINSRFLSYVPVWKKSYRTLLSLDAQISLPNVRPSVLRSMLPGYFRSFRRNYDVDLLVFFDLTVCKKLRVCVYIVNDLRNKAADVDGVRGGKLESHSIQFFREFFVTEDLLYASLGIIKGFLRFRLRMCLRPSGSASEAPGRGLLRSSDRRR